MTQTEKPKRALIVDDDQLFHMAIRSVLQDLFSCDSVPNCDEALQRLASISYEIVFLDISMRTPNEGLDYLVRLKERQPEATFVMTSGRTDFDSARIAMQRGAQDFVPKDFQPEALRADVARILAGRERDKLLFARNRELLRNQSAAQVISKSEAMEHLMRQVRRAVGGRANVLIQGETGTGKELIARQFRQVERDGALIPFVAIDSATIQSSTAESQLFGHERGAFTGADKTKKGLFEEADGGIVFFDEVANMPIEIQNKLLRVLEEKEVVRLGSVRPIPLSFRVIAATNRNLEEMVAKGQFKDDLLQRLQVLPLLIPPLRDRKDDIPALIEHFLRVHSPDGLRFRFSEDALRAMMAYDWPGNVRELGNHVAYVTTMSDSAEIGTADLHPKLRQELDRKSWSGEPQGAVSHYEKMRAMERELLKDSYQKWGDNLTQMAHKLGMDRSHLYAKLKEFGLRAPSGTPSKE